MGFDTLNGHCIIITILFASVSPAALSDQKVFYPPRNPQVKSNTARAFTPTLTQVGHTQNISSSQLQLESKLFSFLYLLIGCIQFIASKNHSRQHTHDTDTTELEKFCSRPNGSNVGQRLSRLRAAGINDFENVVGGGGPSSFLFSEPPRGPNLSRSRTRPKSPNWMIFFSFLTTKH